MYLNGTCYTADAFPAVTPPQCVVNRHKSSSQTAVGVVWKSSTLDPETVVVAADPQTLVRRRKASQTASDAMPRCSVLSRLLGFGGKTRAVRGRMQIKRPCLLASRN
jgi:hypothetical protein